jgi:hypothetical protein
MSEERLAVLVALVSVPELTAHLAERVAGRLAQELSGLIGAPGTELQLIGIHAAFDQESDQRRFHRPLNPDEFMRTVLEMIGDDTEAVLRRMEVERGEER